MLKMLCVQNSNASGRSQIPVFGFGLNDFSRLVEKYTILKLCAIFIDCSITRYIRRNTIKGLNRRFFHTFYSHKFLKEDGYLKYEYKKYAYSDKYVHHKSFTVVFVQDTMLTDGEDKLWRQNILAGEEWVQRLVLGVHGSFKIIERHTWVYIWAKRSVSRSLRSFKNILNPTFITLGLANDRR